MTPEPTNPTPQRGAATEAVTYSRGRSERNYAHEMRAKINELAVGTYIPAMIAHQVVRWAKENDPDLLEGWLKAQAEAFIRQAINEMERSKRAAARHSKSPTSFREDARAHEAGDSTRLRGWLEVAFSLSNGTRMPLKEMTRIELTDVATTYAVRAEGNAMTSAFLKAIASRVGQGRVSDHFDDTTLRDMWGSLTGAS